MDIGNLRDRIKTDIDVVLSERVDENGNIDVSGMSYLEYFCKYTDNYEIIKLLLEKGAIPSKELYDLKDVNILNLLKGNRIEKMMNFINKYYNIKLDNIKFKGEGSFGIFFELSGNTKIDNCTGIKVFKDQDFDINKEYIISRNFGNLEVGPKVCKQGELCKWKYISMDSYPINVYDLIDDIETYELEKELLDTSDDTNLLKDITKSVINKISKSFDNNIIPFDIKFENMVSDENGTDVRIIDFSEDYCIDITKLDYSQKTILKNILILSIYVRLIGMGPNDLDSISQLFNDYVSWFNDVDRSKIETVINMKGITGKKSIRNILEQYFPDKTLKGDILDLYSEMLGDTSSSFGRSKKQKNTKFLTNRNAKEQKQQRLKLLHLSNENYKFNKYYKDLLEKKQNNFGRRNKNKRSIKKIKKVKKIVYQL